MEYWGEMSQGRDVNYNDYYLDADLEKGECELEGLRGKHFSLPDYIIFAILFMGTILIGLFYGCFRGRKSTASEYLMGNRQMHYIPVAMSLISGLLSAISVLGNPAEMYNYGSQLYMFCLAFLISTPVAVSIYVPVYQKLEITSVYEYVNLRFHGSIRSIFSFIFLLQGLIFCSMTVYAPSLALSQVTNLKPSIIVLILFAVCVIFGSVGGVRAIIWSDTFHLAILMITLTIVMVKGTIDAGGIDVVWNDNYNSGRIELFNFDPDPTVRHTFWTVFVGGTIYWTAICAVNQNAIQRFLSLPSMRDVFKTVWLATAGKIIIYTLLFYIGMLLYSAYKNCDPIASKMVQRKDQLLPLYVLDEMETWGGFSGALVASIFSASIGAVATMLNGMTAVTVRDFVQGLLRKKLTEVEAGTLSKFICLGYGIASLGFVFLISQMGGLMQTAYTITGLVGGVGLGTYTLGVFFPWANWKGALGGIIFSFAFMIWVVWGAIMAARDGYQSAHRKPVSIEDCLCNATLEVSSEPPEDILPIYKVSYLWYTAMSMTLSVITGIIISGLTVFQDPRQLDHALISPIAKWFFNKLPPSVKSALNLPMYYTDGKGPLLDMSFENIEAEKCDPDLEEWTHI